MSGDDSAAIVSPRIIARPLFLSFTMGQAGSALPFGSPVAAKFTHYVAMASSNLRSTSVAWGFEPA